MAGFRALLASPTAQLADVQDGRLLVRSDATGTMQLYELTGSELRQITDLPEPVAAGHYRPGSRQAVLDVDTGGNERHQLYLLDLDRTAPAEPSELIELTADPAHGHHFAGLSPDGKLLAYLSNRRNGVDFDAWCYDLAAGEHRLVYAEGGWCQPGSGFSPDGRWLSLLRPGARPLDTDLLLVDPQTGEVRIVLEHPDEAALVGPPAWLDAHTFLVSANVGHDFAGVYRCRTEPGTQSTAAQRLPGTGQRWDAYPVAEPGGSTALVVENVDGAARIRLIDAATLAGLGEIALPEPGVVDSHLISPPRISDGQVYFTFASPRLAGDVYRYALATGQTSRLTESPAPVPAGQLAGAERARLTSFDGEPISLLVFRPSTGAAKPPVVVVVHGGPEGQSVLSFNPVVAGLVGAGYGVVLPNVRGSTGYGKRFAALDDTTRRLDSVRDLAAVHGWLDSAGFDPRRAVLWGGSYGGYLVLAGVAFQPDRWAAGVDIVGISDLETFLTNTSDYRRAHREREYGSLAHDREFLAAASPLRHAAAIRAPLFVIHGRNDPRVPVGEAEQLVETLRGSGIRCELVIYDDEGHGLARLANRLDAYPRAVAFLDEVLGRSPDG